jgi:hypothetical protein
MHIFATTLLSDRFNTFIFFAPSIGEFPSVLIHISFLEALGLEMLPREHVDKVC